MVSATDAQTEKSRGRDARSRLFPRTADGAAAGDIVRSRDRDDRLCWPTTAVNRYYFTMAVRRIVRGVERSVVTAGTRV